MRPSLPCLAAINTGVFPLSFVAFIFAPLLINKCNESSFAWRQAICSAVSPCEFSNSLSLPYLIASLSAVNVCFQRRIV